MKKEINKLYFLNKIKLWRKYSLNIISKINIALFKRSKSNDYTEIINKECSRINVKRTSQYIFEYMTAESKEDIELAIKHIPKNYPF